MSSEHEPSDHEASDHEASDQEASENGSEEGGDSEYDSDEEEELFRFFDLPLELQLGVVRSMDELEQVTNFRLASKVLDKLYLSCKDTVMENMARLLVEPFYDYYAFHVKLHIPESAVMYPPPGGWPHITQENFKHWNKAELVIEVLRHLPYIEQRMDPGCHDNYHNVDYKTNVIDYSKFEPGDEYPGWLTEELTLDGVPGYEGRTTSKNLLAVAAGYESGGKTWVLDTTNGQIYEYVIRMNDGPQEEASWYFSTMQEEFESCKTLFVPGCGTIFNDYIDEEGYDDQAVEAKGEPTEGDWKTMDDVNWVRHLYLKHGWPGEEWNKEEGLKAIVEFSQRRDAIGD